MDFEHQLNTYMESDKRLSKLKAVRLQNYWKKICEDERKSQWRNEQLLRDFDRVEAHMADLHSRTGRLRTMKRQYEEHVERMYPDWKQRIFHFQRIKEREDKIENQHEEEGNRATINSISQPKQYTDASMLYSYLPPEQQHSQHVKEEILQQQQQPPQMSGMSASALGQMPSNITTPSNYDKVTLKEPINGESTIHSLSTIPTGTGISTGQGISGQSFQATSTPHPGHQMEYRSNRVHAKIEEESNHSKSCTREQQQQPSLKQDSDSHSTEVAVTQKEVDAFMAENEQNSYGHSIEAHNHHQLIKKTPSPGRFRNKRQDIREMEDIGDFGNDLDVPPSVRASQPKPTSPNGSEASLTKLGSSHLLSGSSLTKSPKGLHLGSKSSLNKSASRNHDEQSIYVEAEITWNGLYNLLEVVSEQLHTTADKLVYKGDPPAKSVRDEIVSNANRGHMLSYMDTTSLSMVILDQLPLLSAATQEHCILHDNILFKQMKVISLAVVQSQIKPILQGHWNKLYEHFTELLKCRAMSPQEIAETFAPHMISYDSPYETQAVKLLAKLLEETLAEEGMNSQHSTSTFSATPRPKPAVLQKANDSDLEDDIFDHEVPQNTSTVALTQSAAYRQVVGSTLGSTQKSVSYIDSTEEVDDIERELFRGSTKRSSSNDSPARILPSVIEEQQRAGSFRGTTSPKGIGSPAREGALSPASLGSGGMRSPSPHSTGGAGMGGGYVPSGLGDTGRSVAGQSTMSSLGSTGKKMAFMYGDSDTDEDIELPGTEKNARPEEDDFYS